MKRTYLRIKRRSKNPGTAKQFGTGDVYHGTRLTGFFFIVEWQLKEGNYIYDILPTDCLKINQQVFKSATIHVFNKAGASMSFYWDREALHFFNPVANVSGADIHSLVSEFVPVDIVE